MKAVGLRFHTPRGIEGDALGGRRLMRGNRRTHNRELRRRSRWRRVRPGGLLGDWCGPCSMFGPIFESRRTTTRDLVFAKVDTEAQPELAQAFGITSIPTLMVIRTGHPVRAAGSAARGITRAAHQPGPRGRHGRGKGGGQARRPVPAPTHEAAVTTMTAVDEVARAAVLNRLRRARATHRRHRHGGRRPELPGRRDPASGRLACPGSGRL